MADWLKDIQSIGRGIRNGEMTVVMASSRSGKSVIMDMESQGIEPSFRPGFQRNFHHDHWCHNSNTGQWTFHQGRPYHEYIVGSDQIIARNTEGKFYWYKDRESGRDRELTEEELKSLTFVFIGAEQVIRTEEEWVKILKNHAYGRINNP
jgi:hypothetical protein